MCIYTSTLAYGSGRFPSTKTKTSSLFRCLVGQGKWRMAGQRPRALEQSLPAEATSLEEEVLEQSQQHH